MTAPDATVTPSAKTTFGSMVGAGGDLRIPGEENGFRRRHMDAAVHHAGADAVLPDAFDAGQFGLAVGAH